MEKQKELKPGKQLRRLQKLSDTRWACRRGSVNAICCTYDAVVATLLQMEMMVQDLLKQRGCSIK